MNKEEIYIFEQKMEDREKVLTFAQLMLETPDPEPFLVKDIIKKQSLNIIHGATGSGKSLFVLKMIDDISMGVDFLGKFPTIKTKILLLDLEMTKDDCIIRAINVCNSKNDSLILCEQSWKITNTDQVNWLTRIITSYDIGLVVFDTFSKIHNADENNNSEITKVMTSLMEICNNYKVTMLLLHHVNKNKDVSGLSRGRGATAIADNVGMYLEVTSRKTTDIDGNMYMVMTVSNQKSRRLESVGTFDLSIKHDVNTNRTNFEYIGESMAAIDPINRAREEIVKTLENEPGLSMSSLTKKLKNIVTPKDFRDAYKSLLNQKILRKDIRGKFVFSYIVKEDDGEQVDINEVNFNE